MLTTATRNRMRDELRAKLETYAFTNFITLTSNHQELSEQRMRSLLKQWDARINRFLVGPRWQKRPDERLFWFAFPEKVCVNPHWHLLAQSDPTTVLSPSRENRLEKLETQAKREWFRLLPAGSADIQPIDSSTVIGYATKALSNADHFDRFIVSREFENN